MEQKEFMTMENAETLVNEIMASNGYIVLNKKVVRIFGLEASAILGELTAKSKYFKDRGELTDDGYFYSTVDALEENTSIKEKKQRQILNELKAQEIIDVAVRGLPAKRFIKVNYEKLFFALVCTKEAESLENKGI